MQKRRKIQLAVCLVALACLVGYVVAQAWNNVPLTFNGGISAVGSIAVYGSDGVTSFTGFTFPNFTAIGNQNVSFYVNNAGNTAVNVVWNLTSGAYTWNNSLLAYETSDHVFQVYVYKDSAFTQQVYPTSGAVTTISIAKGARQQLWLVFQVTSTDTPKISTFGITLWASS